MQLNNEIINDIINRSTSFVDSLVLKYNYSDNIGHLLYLLVPAFIVKYGINNEKKILNTFDSIPIFVNDVQDKVNQAFYMSTPYIDGNEIKTKKIVVLNNYKNIDLMNLLDNLIHEYNHAVNSILYEITFDNKEIKLRTGLTHIVYDRHSLQPIRKENDYILEEIINTKQTEEIIDIINSFNNYDLKNSIISTTLFSIKNNINNKYISDAYGFESYLCKQLMENKTFISTLGILRLNGNTSDMEYWFNNITGISDSYNKLIKLLISSVKVQEEYEKSVLFKKMKLNKLRTIYNEAMEIINTFNNNCNFK